MIRDIFLSKSQTSTCLGLVSYLLAVKCQRCLTATFISLIHLLKRGLHPCFTSVAVVCQPLIVENVKGLTLFCCYKKSWYDRIFSELGNTQELWEYQSYPILFSYFGVHLTAYSFFRAPQNGLKNSMFEHPWRLYTQKLLFRKLNFNMLTITPSRHSESYVEVWRDETNMSPCSTRMCHLLQCWHVSATMFCPSWVRYKV